MGLKVYLNVDSIADLPPQSQIRFGIGKSNGMFGDCFAFTLNMNLGCSDFAVSMDLECLEFALSMNL